MTRLPPELLQELKQDYLNGLPSVISEIKAALVSQDWEAIEKHFHRLAGSGQTYGLPEITVVGRKVEDYLQKNSNPSHEFLEKALSELEMTLKRAS